MKLPEIELLTFSGNRGYLGANAKDGFTTIRVNKATGGYEIKIDNVSDMDEETKKWLGCEEKDNDKNPSVSKKYLLRVLWLVQNPKEMEARKIKLGFPTDLKVAEERLNEAIKQAKE